MTARAPTPKERQRRYQEAFLAGRTWAAQELKLVHETGEDADFEDDLDAAAAAYLALQTGQLPSRVNDFASFERMFDLKQGFYDGAQEVFTESAAATSAEDKGEAYDNDAVQADPDAHSIFLTVEIELEQHLIEECIAQAAHSLREVAQRLEQGEAEGILHDKDGLEIGSFDLMPLQIGPRGERP